MKQLISICLILLTFTICLIGLDLRDISLHLYFLDIGQGDSILVRTPDRKLMLIDAGPGKSVLNQLGRVLPDWVNKIDYILLTHGDSDHIYGFIEVMKRYKVGTVIMNRDPSKSTQTYTEILALSKDIKEINVDETSDFTLGCCVVIDFVWPLKNYGNAIAESNDKSISFVLRSNDFTAFFGGDLSSEYEDNIFKENEMDVDLLKAGHHGSRTSTSSRFLDKIKPEVVVITVGKNNKFGHPHREVLDNLRNRNIKVARTDESGCIEVIVQENNYRLIYHR